MNSKIYGWFRFFWRSFWSRPALVCPISSAWQFSSGLMALSSVKGNLLTRIQRERLRLGYVLFGSRAKHLTDPSRCCTAGRAPSSARRSMTDAGSVLVRTRSIPSARTCCRRAINLGTFSAPMTAAPCGVT